MAYVGNGIAGGVLVANANGEPVYKKDSVLSTSHANWLNQFIFPPVGKTTVYKGTGKIVTTDDSLILSLNKSGGKMLEADFITRWCSHTNYSANGASSASQDVTPGQDGWFRFGDILVRAGTTALIEISFSFPGDSDIWCVEMKALGENPSSQFCEYRTVLAWNNALHPFQNAYLSFVGTANNHEYQIATVQGVPL